MRLQLIFDCETNGLAKTNKGEYPPYNQVWNYPQILSLSWIIYDTENGNVVDRYHFFIKQLPDFVYDETAGAIHNITEKQLEVDGVEFEEVVMKFYTCLSLVNNVYAYNVQFDYHVLLSNLFKFNLEREIRGKIEVCLRKKKKVCIMLLASRKYGKWQRLEKVHNDLIGLPFVAHNSLEDVLATARVYSAIKKRLSKTEIKKFELVDNFV